MATVRSTSWTGSDAAAWTLDSGSWTQVTESGTFSVGPTEDIRSNKGRANGTASAAAVRRHHASSTTFLNIEASVNVVRSALTCKPGLMIRATGTGASESFYLLQAETTTGKSTTYGYTLYKCVSGTYTNLASNTDMTGFSTLTNTLYFALRAATFANGNVKLQWKAYATGTSDPGWTDVAGDTAGTANHYAGSGVWIDGTATIKNTAGTLGIYTEIDSAVAYQADYDDLLVVDTWANTLVAPVISAPATLLAPSLQAVVRLPVIDSKQVQAAVLKDMFTRADSTTLWGDGGISWTAATNSAAIGTSGNMAYVSSAPSANPGATYNSTNSATYQDGTVSVDLFNVQQNTAVFLKYVNSDNYLTVFVFSFSGLHFYLGTRLAGGGLSPLTFMYTTSAGADVNITATYSGDLVRITISNYWTKAVLNETTYTITDAIFRGTSTYSGFGAVLAGIAAPATRFDNWYQTQSNSTGLVSGPQPPKVNLGMGGPVVSAPATVLAPQVNLATAVDIIAAPVTLLAPTVTQSSAFPPVFAGSTQVTAIYAETTAVTKLYAGSTLVWP